MLHRESRQAISLALLLTASITFQSFAFTGVATAQKLKPLRTPATKPNGGGIPTTFIEHHHVARMLLAEENDQPPVTLSWSIRRCDRTRCACAAQFYSEH